MFQKHALLRLPLWLLLVAMSLPVCAQVYTGSMTGVVKDPSGAIVPNATVTLTDAGKGFNYTTHTDANGLYTVSNLPPGTYTQTVEATGFNTYKREGIQVEVTAAVRADATLTLGSAGNQTVTVSESAEPMLQTENATTGQTVNRTYINNLPLINRQVFDLAFLAPGVSQPTGNAYGQGSNIANNFVSTGERNAQSDILIDGISTTASNSGSKSVFLAACSSCSRIRSRRASMIRRLPVPTYTSTVSLARPSQTCRIRTI